MRGDSRVGVSEASYMMAERIAAQMRHGGDLEAALKAAKELVDKYGGGPRHGL